MGVSVCLGAILILEYLDLHSGYYAPSSRIARRAGIMTSLLSTGNKDGVVLR